MMKPLPLGVERAAVPLCSAPNTNDNLSLSVIHSDRLPSVLAAETVSALTDGCRAACKLDAGFEFSSLHHTVQCRLYMVPSMGPTAISMGGGAACAPTRAPPFGFSISVASE